MSTSRNMPARFKSRTHLKIYCESFRNCPRKNILVTQQGLNDYHNFIRKRYKNGQSLAFSRSNLKLKLLHARRYRKSVVLPRLP